MYGVCVFLSEKNYLDKKKTEKLVILKEKLLSEIWQK